MPRTKTVTDEEVLRIAREVILAQGTVVSTTEIAKHVGLSQATLFQRFGDKQTLISRALSPAPVEASIILGPPNELDKLGISVHLARLSQRMFDAMLEIMQQLQIMTPADMLNPESSSRAHNAAAADSVIAAIKIHLQGLSVLDSEADEVAEALLMLVHGAVAQAVSNLKKRQTARIRLGAVVKLMVRNFDASP